MRGSLEARWIAANRHAINALHGRAREHAQSVFNQTLQHVREARSGPHAPQNIAELVRRELTFPGRYHATIHVVTPRSPWWLAAWNWVTDRWSDFLHALAAHVHLGRSGAVAIGDILVIAAVAAVAVVLARMLMMLQREQRDRRVVIEPLETRRGAHALWLAASAAAERGEYASAVRFLFTAAVTLLDLRGLLRDDAAATINELRSALRSREGALEPPFVDVARAYTAVAYAERPVDAVAWDRARSAYAALLAHVNRNE